MIIELSEKALNEILKSEMQSGIPDVSWFNQDVIIELKNILKGSPSFTNAFNKAFKPDIARIISEKLERQVLKLKIYKDKSNVPNLMIYQTFNLSDIFPKIIKNTNETEFVYLNVAMSNKNIEVTTCVLGEDNQKIMGIFQIFNLIALVTMNHLKQPKKVIHVNRERVKRVKNQQKDDNTPSKTSPKVYYYRPYIYRTRARVDKIKPENLYKRDKGNRNFYQASWQRKGHWRNVKLKNGTIKQVWINEKTVSRNEELLGALPNKRIRIASMGRKEKSHG